MINFNKILILLFLFCFSCINSIPQVCTIAQRWSINGRAFVDEYKGKVVFLIFMRLDCAVCEPTIRRCDSFMKYEAIAEHFNNEIKIVVVAPHSESDSRLQHLQSQYPRVRLAKESHQEPLWGWLKVGHNDGLIFDRCGRLAKVLQLPSEGIESSNLVSESVKSVLTGQPCGYCSYDKVDARTQPTPQVPIPMITAYVSPASRRAEEDKQNYYKRNQQDERRQNYNPNPYVNPNPNPRYSNFQEDARRQQNINPNPSSNSNSRQNGRQEDTRRQNPNPNPNPYSDPRYNNQQEDARRQQNSNPNPRYNNQQDARRQNPNSQSGNFQEDERKQQNSNPRSDNARKNDKNKQAAVEEFESVTIDYRRESEGKIFAQQQQPGVFNNDWVEVDSKSKFGRLSDESLKKPNSSEPPKKADSSKKMDSENSDPPKKMNSKKSDSFYSDTEDLTSESDYYDYVADLTTPNPDQVQIPKPSSPSPFWPTMLPMAAAGSGQNCAGYNEDICYQQFVQLDESEVHPCCKKKIVLTDQCVPGKCSNVTQQLCCIQKFLQAKLTCCLDEKQLIPTSATDKFSKCCYDHFATSDDNCCPFNYASAQWKSVHELCLPNVKIDLSDIKVKTYVPGTSVTTDFDFKFAKRWNFECKFGNQVPQYSYFESWYNN